METMLFQILQFLISEYKYTFQSCIFDLNNVKARKNLASYFVLNMKIYIALYIELQSLEFCSPNQGDKHQIIHYKHQN